MQHDVIETTKNLLFDQYRSAINSYDSSQDSLDKAYLAILFGDIAFYATKINILCDNLWVNLIAMSYMVGSLVLILISFAFSKLAMAKYKEITIYQLGILSGEETNTADLLELKLRQLKIDSLNRWIRQFNWHIPFVVFISSSICFIKVSFISLIQIKILWGLMFVSLLSGLIEGSRATSQH